ncbi:MAG TPA: PRC-barrel domain-containing protein [Noviherbaspirillum sp.]
MLHSIKALMEFTVEAGSDAVGRVHDIYFDDSQWRLRYFVIDAGDREVLLSPLSVGHAAWDTGVLRFDLSVEQIRNSPDMDTVRPVSRQYEETFNVYYGYPYYWASPQESSPIYPGIVERQPLNETEKRAIKERLEDERRHTDPHLRSSDEVIGYRIQASDDRVGHVEDFLIDESDWSIRLMVVDTRNWLPGKHVLIAPYAIERVEWDARAVYLDITRQELETSPAYDPDNPPQSDAAVMLHRPVSRDPRRARP